ncbi:unnamed protein product [Aphanomyces euteiches]
MVAKKRAADKSSDLEKDVERLAEKWTNAKSLSAYDASLVSHIFSSFLSPTKCNDETAKHALSVLASTGYLENYLWPQFSADSHGKDAALLLSILTLANEKGHFWASVDGAKFASFFEALARFKMSATSLSFHEQAVILRFLVQSIRQLDHEHIAKTLLKFTSLPVWTHLTDTQRNIVFADHPKLKRHWQNRQAKAAPSSPAAKKRKIETIDLDADFYPHLLRDLKSALGVATDDDKAPDAVHYVAHALDLWIDLICQLPTRRFLRTLLLNQHLLPACRHSELVKQHVLLTKQVELLHFYVHFPIDDQTGHAWSLVEHKNELASRVHAFQVAAFAADPALQALSLLPMSSLSNRSILQTQLALIPDEILVPFAASMGLVADEQVDLVDVFMDRFMLHAPPALTSLPLFPTETDMWASDLASHGHILSTRKLNLQFLSLADYLYRNYELHRLEAAYGVREDLENVIRALGASVVGRRTVFERRHSMAAAIESIKVVRVDQPAIGELHPAQVVAQITLDLPTQAVTDWDAVQTGEVLFLVWLQPPEQPHEESKPELNFAESHGVHGVRGAQVLQLLDGHGTAIGELQEDGTLSQGKGGRRVLRVSLDGAQYALDVANGATDVYTNVNLVVRRDAKVNTFKPLLDTMQDILRQDIQQVIPSWFSDVFLGYGDPASAHYSSLASSEKKVPLFDTFVDGQHALSSFPSQKVSLVDSNTGKPIENPTSVAAPFTLIRSSTDESLTIQGTTSTSASTTSTIRFTPGQVDAIQSGMHRGLTVVVGPPGTGKTDVAVQLVSNLYQAHPHERIVIITQANDSLDDFFLKLVAKNVVDPGHLLRLGAASSDDERDLSRDGRVKFLLARRLVLLEQVERLAQAIGGAAATCGASHSCAQAQFFYKRYLLPALDAPGDLESFLETFTNSNDKAGVSAYLARLFQELDDLSAFEVLRTVKQRGDFLIVKHARVIAMTSTQATQNRARLVAMGFTYSTLVMEEAGQVSDIESLVAMVLQKQAHTLERVVLLGDHAQLPPVVKHTALKQYANLDQSLFTRLVRLGAPVVQLDRQGRSRPSISALFKWKYKELQDLDPTRPEFTAANPGFRHTFQFIDVSGGSEVSPRPLAFENHLEAMYIVQVYQYMRLVGYDADRITVLTTYDAQKNLLESMFQPGKDKFGLPSPITTVDQFQGQQNDYVLLSLVRTKEVGHIRDVRRAIVAVSRARLGLYVFGKKALFGPCVDLTSIMTPLSHATLLELVPSEHVGKTKRQEKDKVAKTETISNVQQMSEFVAKMNQ